MSLAVPVVARLGRARLEEGLVTWKYGKEHEKRGHDKDWRWGKDPDCDPPMTHTPEPGTLLLLGSSLAAAGVAWRKRPRAMEPCE